MTIRTRTSALRTRVRSLHSLVTGLRTRVMSLGTRVSVLRVPVRTQHAATTGIRLLVRSTHMTVSIGGTLVAFDEDTWKLSPRLDDIWHFQATILDYTGTLLLPYESQVIVYDDTRGTLFTGLLVDDKMDKSNTYPDPATEHQIDCIDNRRRASKRTSDRIYTSPTYAGKIVVDMVDDALAAEGVSAPHVTQVTSTTADWAAGTLTGTVASTSLGDGDLELSGSGGATITASYLTQTSWNSGTLSSVQTNSDTSLSLIGAMRNWNDGKYGNQALFGISDSSEKSSITQGVTSGQFWLTCPAGDEARSRQDWAGTWANGTFEVDMQLTASGPYWSLTYRTTNWNNTDNTYAYAVNLNMTTIILNRGPNGGSSSTAWTNLASVTFSPKLGTGWYRLRVVVSGSSHKVYLNGVQKISVTDGTYTAAGMLALRNRNTNTTGSLKEFFDNFGILSALSGTWTSASTSINAAGTILSSQISWDASLSSGGTVLVQISLDGGSTYQACSNGGLIPGLAPGASAVGKSLLLKITLSTTSTVLLPKIRSLSWTVVGGGYAVSGTRVSPGLDLTPVGRAGASFLSWTQTLPSDATSVDMDISFDTLDWTDVTMQNGQAIPGIFSQPDPTVDSFSSNTSLNYSTPLGGSAATFTYDTANSRLVATGGTTAFYLNSTIVNADVDLLCDLDWADTGGLVWGYADKSTYYLCTITDHLATSGTPQRIQLWKSLSYRGVILVATPQAYYRLDETSGVIAHDSSGNGYDATLSGATLSQAGLLTGDTNTSILFTAGGGLTIPPALSLAANSWTALSVEFWTDLGGGRHHVVMVASGSTTTLYVDGATTTSSSSADVFVSNDLSNALFGSLIASGRLDEVAIYNYGLTAGQVAARYTTGTSGGSGLLVSTGISFVRGTHHRLRVTNASGTISVSLDGGAALSYTDAAPLGAGLMGLYQSGNQSRYSQLWLQPLGDSLAGVTLYTRQRLASSDSTVTPQVEDLTIVVFSPSIDLGTLIPSADYRKKFIDKAYDDLSKQSNYSWFIDPLLLLRFHHRQAYPAPWILQSTTLGLDSSLEVDSNLLMENASDLYRNRQTLTGVIFTGIFQNLFSGDTKRTSFTLSFPVVPGTTPSLTLNLVRQKVDKKGTTGAQWYYAEGDATIAQDTGGTTLSSTDTLVVSYTGTYIDNLTINNTDAQAALAPVSGGSGIVEAVEDVSQRNMTSDAALVYAQQLLARYCVIDTNNLPTGRTLTFKTYRDGLQVGQTLTCFVPEEHLLDIEQLITAIDITMQTQPGGVALYGYVVTATELPSIARWAKLLASGLFD